MSGLSVDHAFAAQALQHFAHAEKGQGNIQLQQVAVHAAHAQAAVAFGGGQQGVDDFQADQAGAQAKALEQEPDPFVAVALGTLVENAEPMEVPIGAVATVRWQLRVVHAKTPFQSLIRKMYGCSYSIRRMSDANHEGSNVEILSPSRQQAV